MDANFFRINLELDEFEIQRVEYSDDRLRELRAAHNPDASFFRNGDFVYVSPEWGVDLNVGPLTRVTVADNVEIVESLIRHMLFRRFHEEFPDRTLDSFSPLRFRSEKYEHSIIRNYLPNELKDKVSYARSIDVHVRSMRSLTSPVFGILVTMRHRWCLSESLLDISTTGFSVKGCTVLESVPIPGLDGILAPDENVLGRIAEVDGTSATVETNSGFEERQLANLTLQRTRSQIGDYLRHRVGERVATQIFQNIADRSAALAHPASAFTEVFQVAKWFAAQRYQNSDGFSFSITTDNSLGDQTTYRILPTRLIFDIAPGASSPRPLSGLLNHGPYDSTRFDRKAPRILVIFQESSRGAATQFLARLKEGLPDSQYFKKGLRDLFQLNDVQYVPVAVSSNSPESYETAIDQAVEDAGRDEFDLAIVEFVDESEQFPPSQNPYLRAKARLMGLGITVQGVRESHLRESERFQSNTLGPLSLQIYAKLGGTPWLLPGSQSVDHEVVVGVGNSVHRPNLWSGADQSRIVGLTTFFLGDGRYALGEELPSVPYEQYFDTLLSSLKQSIGRLSQEYAWAEGDSLRLVFHVFKPLKDVEIGVVDQLVRELTQFDIRYAFVTISTRHPWMLFRSTSAANPGKTKWSVSLCERGDNVVLDSNSCLVQLRGAGDRTNRRHRHPNPALVRIHENSTYRDLQFIAQQIHDFSYLSWRSFFPIELPVTIDYANKMAKLSAKLAHVPNWNPACLARHFRKKKWFL